MPSYNLFQRLIYPFYNAEFYRHMVRDRKGMGIKPLFFVLTLNWLVVCLVGLFSLFSMTSSLGWTEFKRGYNHIMDELPVITIEDGKASINEPSPYFIKDPSDSGVNLVVIDTSDNPKDMAEYGTVFAYMTQEYIILHKSTRESRIYYFSDYDDIVLDRDMIEGFGKGMLIILIPIIGLTFIGGSYLFRLLQLFIYGGLGYIFTALFSVKLEYDQICRLAATALTPVLLLDMVFFFTWDGSGQSFFNFCLAMIFLGYGVYSQKSASNPTPTS